MDNYHVLVCLKERPKNYAAKWNYHSKQKLKQMFEQTAEAQECHFCLPIIPFT